jgi:hypothetical protein
LPAGSYHLIAAAGPPGQLVEFAAQRRLLTIGQAASVSAPHASTAVPPVAVFSSGPTLGDLILKDASDVLG